MNNATLLKGLRVLDCTRLLPGAFATQMIVDWGAEVWKIEEVMRGDYMRYVPPFIKGWGAMFYAYNRGKKSIGLNLKEQQGVDILKALVKKSDVLVESFRPGVMDRLGVGYAALKAINPKLIYCAITGFGQEGPYASKAGHDVNYLSLAGALQAHGVPERPVLSSFQVADCAGGGMFGVIGILLALLQRERTQAGAFVDTSMFEGVAYWMSQYYAMASLGTSLERERLPLSGGVPNYRVYPTKDDRFIGIGSLEPKFLQELSAVLGIEIPVVNPFLGFDKQAVQKMEDLFRTKTLAEWQALFAQHDICVEPVRTAQEALDDPHLKARGIVRFHEHAGKKIAYAATPIRINQLLYVASESRAPELGEHTSMALQEVGYDEARIQKLAADGVVRL